jgi:hypothetical protein
VAREETELRIERSKSVATVVLGTLTLVLAGCGDDDSSMERNGSYGYYVTGTDPWVIGCFVGTPDDSFRKAR